MTLGMHKIGDIPWAKVQRIYNLSFQSFAIRSCSQLSSLKMACRTKDGDMPLTDLQPQIWRLDYYFKNRLQTRPSGAQTARNVKLSDLNCKTPNDH